MTSKPDPQSFIPGYRVRYVEFDTVCAWLVDNGWAGGIPFDQAVKAMVIPDKDIIEAALELHIPQVADGPFIAACSCGWRALSLPGTSDGGPEWARHVVLVEA